ncbi:MAG: DUF389 domain-containing protein [Chitinophagaceae bacterium]|nr:DUF389 domain-containing protein [Chitinophagaceae bacterium]HQV05950.1 DUF389 domain-containing protein [Chitinophagaceae bacterium]
MGIKNSRTYRIIKYAIAKIRLPKDAENIRITTENIKSGAVLTGVNLWVLVGAVFIASLGLNMNSTAVVIGAMLISPLMGPIMGFGFGLGTNDFALMNKSIRNFIIMVVLSVAASTLFFWVSPLKTAGSELLGRTSPTVYDVLIAFFGGMAGIIAGASKLRSGNVVPGVAIATALMPPLCTMGYGISHLNWQYTAGAFYLFMINSVFIALATYFIVNLLRYPHVEFSNSGRQKKLKIIIPVIVALMIAPSVYLTYHIVKKYFYEQYATKFMNKEILDGKHVIVTSKMSYQLGNSQLKLVVVGEPYDSLDEVNLKKKMKSYGLLNTKLTIYQGNDGRVAAREMFGALDKDMESTRSSIKDIYLTMDSIQQQLNEVKVLDSLQASIAKEIKNSDSTLQRFSLRRTFSFNPSKNRNDTLWYAVAGYSTPITVKHRFDMNEWLKIRLRSPNVVFSEE